MYWILGIWMHVLLLRLDILLCDKLRPLELRLWWHRLWIRESERHVSLDLDYEILDIMSRGQRDTYMHDVACRRQIAHRRDQGEKISYDRKWPKDLQEMERKIMEFKTDEQTKPI